MMNWIASTGYSVMTPRGDRSMSKGMDRKKETKKKPAKTMKEKRAAKAAKKG
jgi:hypothetical protein